MPLTVSRFAVARVAAQPAVQLDLDRGDLIGQHQHQPPLRGQPGRVGSGQRQRVQQPGRGVGLELGRGQPDVVLGQQRPDPGLHGGGQLHQLAAVPDQLPQLPQLRRGDVGLGQRPEPEQVRQLVGVGRVGLDPLALAQRLHPQRVRQVHLEPGREQRVDRPVPAVGRLDRHRTPRPTRPCGTRQPTPSGRCRSAPTPAVRPPHPARRSPTGADADRLLRTAARQRYRRSRWPPFHVGHEQPQFPAALTGAGGPAPLWHQLQGSRIVRHCSSQRSRRGAK